MFKKFREQRQLKKTKLILEVAILSKVWDVMQVFSLDGLDTQALVEMAKNLQGVDPKDFVSELVGQIKPEEE